MPMPPRRPLPARRPGLGFKAAALAFGLFVLGLPAIAQAVVSPAERRAVLEATRPLAAKRAGQPVKFKVERLNVDGGWALLMGELVSATGAPLDWSRAKGCHPELDKLLWVLLARERGRWQVKRLEVCATEFPHWTPEQFGGLVWPCGVYAGLQSATGDDLQAACLKQRSAPPAVAPKR